MSNINLYIDFGSTFTKVTAIDIDNEEIVGTAKAFTTIETDIFEGFAKALGNLFEKTGKLDFTEKFASSSAAGGLKMVTIGLVPQLTAEASRRAALGAGAKVLKVFAYQLTQDDIDEINNLDVDIILLCGGTDGGNRDNIIFNAEKLTEINKSVPVVYAGNRHAAYDCRAILEKKFEDIRITENVMPELEVLNVEPVRKTIREVFLERIIEAKGFLKAQRELSGILMPTPSAVLNAARLFASGTQDEPGIGELIVVDPGGATTDVHSIAKGNPTKEGVIRRGLQEPFEKRTVEGDLGLRYSLNSLVDAVGIEKLSKESGLENIKECLDKLAGNMAFVPEKEEDFKLDNAICKTAVEAAVKRHSGIIETTYTPFGASYIQTGKDLTGVKHVIGTGGAIVHSDNPKFVLEGALFDTGEPNFLKPMKPKFMVDREYIMYAFGLLGETYPDKAVMMMKKYIVEIS